jgi:hypothetical protein
VHSSTESRKIAEERVKLDREKQELNALIRSMKMSLTTSF